MEIRKFRDLFLAELQELLSAEQQLCNVLLRMAGAASHPDLKRALIHHRAETETQAARLETILLKHGANPGAHVDQAMRALIAETMKMLAMLKSDNLRDAGLIASAQRIEHYEIAAYGTLCALAKQLGYREALALLKETLAEEKSTDEKLTMLAEGGGNQRAAREAA